MWNNALLINSLFLVAATTYMIYCFFAAILLVRWEWFFMVVAIVIADTFIQLILGILQE